MYALKLLLLCLPLLAGFSWPEDYPLQPEIVRHDPGQYLLMVQHGTPLQANLDFYAIQSKAFALGKQYDLAQLQFAFYDEGKQEGDGLRCLWDIIFRPEAAWTFEVYGRLLANEWDTLDEAQQRAEGKRLEAMLGPRSLDEIYRATAKPGILNSKGDMELLRPEIALHIPGQYLLLVQRHISPEARLDHNDYESIDYALRFFGQAYGVNEVQFALYNEGKQEGDGIRCFGRMAFWPHWERTIWGRRTLIVQNHTDLAAQRQEDKRLEAMVGCRKSPAQLYSLVAGGSPAIVQGIGDGIVDVPFIIPLWVERVHHDKKGAPFVRVPGHRWGTRVEIHFSPEDSLLPQLYLGNGLTVRGYVREVAHKTVIVDASIVSASIEESPWEY